MFQHFYASFSLKQLRFINIFFLRKHSNLSEKNFVFRISKSSAFALQKYVVKTQNYTQIPNFHFNSELISNHDLNARYNDGLPLKQLGLPKDIYIYIKALTYIKARDLSANWSFITFERKVICNSQEQYPILRI